MKNNVGVHQHFDCAACRREADAGKQGVRGLQFVKYGVTNGLEAGIVKGDGNEKPIGMVRQVGEGVSVTNGAYPAKAKVAVNEASPRSSAADCTTAIG